MPTYGNLSPVIKHMEIPPYTKEEVEQEWQKSKVDSESAA
jgi:hypothetical protein